MDFEIIFYRDKKGNSPIEEFLIELKELNNPLAGQTFKGLEKLKNSVYHREPLSKYIESKLWELRVRAGNDILRVVYTFEKGQKIFLLHVFVKKQQKVPLKELKIARKRLKDLKDRRLI